MIDKDLALKLIKDKPWHHSFEIIPGVFTKGSYDPKFLWNELRLPNDLRGFSLADVGASNGYFSFEARKREARVVAFDFRHKNVSGFGLAQHINGMHDIEHHQINVLDLRHQDYGQFDIVLCLGLLYHTSDPYLALANCARLSRKRLFIESYCIDPMVSKELRKEPLMRFISDPQRFPQYGNVNNDRSNFWGFTSVCLQRMVEDVGFQVKRLNLTNDRVFIDCERASSNNNDTRLDIAYGLMDKTPTVSDVNDPEHWIII